MKKTIILTSIFFILSSCSGDKNEIATIEDNTKDTKIEEVIIVDKPIENDNITDTGALEIEENKEVITEEKEILKEIIKDKAEEVIIDDEIEIMTDELIDDLSDDFDKELDQEILNLFK